MLERLRMSNVGPAPTMELELGKRLNLLTGDNGLGKSFLLDIAWWALTRKWPAEINPKLTAGKKALPAGSGDATISFSFSAKSKQEDYESTYVRKEQAWTGRAGRPANPGLVLYAMSDGSFAVWDPARNYWRKSADNTMDVQERPPAYVFTPREVWDGLYAPEGTRLCNGLIDDWAGWHKEKGDTFKLLKEVLAALSPSGDEKLTPGDLIRISLDDARDMPTIKMPYGQSVAVVHASSGMQRIMALSYFLVWAWEEHKKAAKLLDDKPTRQVIFLIDEIESHLHPSWQRSIAPAVLSVVDKLIGKAEVQLITATHSPLVMASVEPLFDKKRDKWFDIDYEQQKVVLTSRDFEKYGDVSNWLTSEAFDLKSSRSMEAEKVLDEVAIALSDENFDKQKAEQLQEQLRNVVGAADPIWLRWRFVAEKKGWLS